jgi:poly(A) polymerase
MRFLFVRVRVRVIVIEFFGSQLIDSITITRTNTSTIFARAMQKNNLAFMGSAGQNKHPVFHIQHRMDHDMKLFLPNHLYEPGSGVYLVGGSVRDYLMGGHPADLDLAVSSNALGYAKTLAQKIKGRLVVLGKERFSLYRIVKGPLIIDVAPLKGHDIASDIEDRDFTINGLACHLSDGQIIDLVGGIDDLDKKRIRLISDRIFEADPVRLLRAHRMAICLGLHITSDTKRAITLNASRIRHAAGERIWTELRLIFAHKESHEQILEMAECGTLEAVLPEMGELRGCSQDQYHQVDVWQHTLQAYHEAEALLKQPDDILPPVGQQFVKSISTEYQVLLKLVILLHDIGKPACRVQDVSGRIHFYGHAACGEPLIRRICRRLRISSRHSQWIQQMVKHHQWPLNLYLSQRGTAFKTKSLGRFLRQCGPLTPYLLLHAAADCLGKENHDNRAVYLDFIWKTMSIYFKNATAPDQRPLLNGHDLQNRFALAPSPLIGELLRQIEDARLAGIIESRDQAFQMAADLLKKKP